MEINLFRVKYIVSQMAFYVITSFFGENRDNHLGNSRFSVSFCVSGNRTCSDIKRFYPRTPSDSYVIDPDGEGGEKPFKVFCDMTNKGGIGVTVVSHDSESRMRVDGFDVRGSYSRNVTYNEASLIQLASLTASSAHCEQFIKYECYHSMLLFNGNMYGWWVSRDDEKMKYWGGVDSAPFKCACGLDNTCAATSHGFNCDKNDWNWREDSSLLTNKSKLHVIQMRFGDTGLLAMTMKRKSHAWKTGVLWT